MRAYLRRHWGQLRYCVTTSQQNCIRGNNIIYYSNHPIQGGHLGLQINADATDDIATQLNNTHNGFNAILTIFICRYRIRLKIITPRILAIPPSPAFQLAQMDSTTHAFVEELSTTYLIKCGKQNRQNGQNIDKQNYPLFSVYARRSVYLRFSSGIYARRYLHLHKRLVIIQNVRNYG